MYKKEHFHFVGINGIGMSGIAKILHKQGHIISGCDLACDTTNIQELIDGNCKISNQHNSTICNDSSITTVVYSSSISYENQELISARNKGIKTVLRAAILAEIMRTKFAIGVAGSHGKTTTSSVIAHILMHAKTDPTVIVGGIMHNTKNNAHYGTGKYTVAEADESDRSHLLLPVTLAVLTNIDFEHTNIYKDLNEVIETFKTYLNQLPFYGKGIVCLDDQNIVNMLPSIDSSTITYGTSNQANIQAVNIQLNANNSSFDVLDNRTKEALGSITMEMPSIYNVLNATAAITTAIEIEIPFHIIAEALQSFQGIDRRFTYKGMMKSPAVKIFDDYGHHPTEIKHSLITARRKTKKKLIVVFQPQRYTRTYHLWDEFIEVFQSADIDHLIITDIAPASEAAIKNVTGQRLAQEILDKNPLLSVHYTPFHTNLQEIKSSVLKIVSDDDLLLLLGAGKINTLDKQLL